MFRVYGSGTAQMASKKAGDLIHLFGPLGNGFPALDTGSDIIMAAGGIGLPPLYFLAGDAIRKGFPSGKISFIAGARSGSEFLTEPGLFELGLTPLICTDDGTAGRKGTVVDILKESLLATSRAVVYACGPNAMLRAVDMLLSERQTPGLLSLEALMPCGYGICSGCAVKVRPPAGRGPTDDRRDYHLKRVCIEGPVFPSGEVLWDR
jgi:dihydroorotate dehydrogenase electron transfer subunit